jgi:hypothetical protein
VACAYCNQETPDDLALCAADIGRITRTIGTTPGLLADLAVTIAKQAKVADQTRKAKSLHAPAPANLDAIDKKHRLRAEFVNAALAVSRVSRDRAPASGSMAQLAWWLMPKADWFGHDFDTAEAGIAFLDAHAAAVRAIDLPVEKIDVGPCGQGDCTERILAPRGRHTAKCAACGTIWDVQERRESAVLAAHVAPVPVPVIVKALGSLGYPVNLKAVEHWTQRGKLEPVGRNPKGQPLYQLAPAFYLAKALHERRAQRASRESTKVVELGV